MKLLNFIEDNWDWLTLFGSTVTAWFAHVNWPYVIAALEWLRARGGFGRWLFNTLIWGPVAVQSNPPVRVEYTAAQLADIAAHPGEDSHAQMDAAAVKTISKQ